MIPWVFRRHNKMSPVGLIIIFFFLKILLSWIMTKSVEYLCRITRCWSVIITTHWELNQVWLCFIKHLDLNHEPGVLTADMANYIYENNDILGPGMWGLTAPTCTHVAPCHSTKYQEEPCIMLCKPAPADHGLITLSAWSP